MKKIFLLSLLSLAIQLSAHGETIGVNLQFSDSVLTVEVTPQGFSMLKLGSLMSDGIVGQPRLPIKYLSFALPANAFDCQVNNVRTSYKPLINLSAPIELVASPFQGSQENVSEDLLHVEHVTNHVVDINGVENFHGINTIVTLSISPVIYDNERLSVSVLNDISFNVNYTIDNSQIDKDILWNKLSSQEREREYEWIHSVVYNPNDINHEDYTPNDIMPMSTETIDYIGGLRVYEYSIITNKELGKSFERLAALKRQTGLDAGIIYIEDILSNSLVEGGDAISSINDDAGKLREFLSKASGTTNLKYVLLGGKYPIIPIRYATVGGNYSSTMQFDQIKDVYHVPSDMYFANFSRNWNADGDDFYGEFVEDTSNRRFITIFNQSLNVGRIPCSTVEEVENYIDKLEIYTFNPGFGDRNYLNSAFTHFSHRSLTDDYGCSRYDVETVASSAIGSKFSNHDINYQTCYQQNTGKYVVDKINSKHYGVLDFHCHGNPSELAVCDSVGSWRTYLLCAKDSYHRYGIDENGNGIDNFTNFGYPNICYSISCTMAPFDAPSYNGYGENYEDYNEVPATLAESYLLGKNYGGVALIANSREGLFGYSTAVEREFFNNLYFGGVNSEISWAYIQSKRIANDSGLGVYKSYGFWARISANLLGDPQLKVWRDIPFEHGEFSVNRGTHNLQVMIPDESSWNSINGSFVVVEPDGTVHKEYASQLHNFNGVSPNSVVSVICDNTIPAIGDLNLQNITTNSYHYVYANKAYVGRNVLNLQEGDVVFAQGTDYVIDAKGDVFLRPGTKIQAGAKVTVYTPTSCYFDGIEIEPGGLLKVQADTVIYTLGTNRNRFSSNQLNVACYDKYRTGRDVKPVVIDENLRMKSRGEGYKPMLEEGKEWRYTISDFRTFTSNRIDDFSRIYRIDGKCEIEGKEYYVMNVYSNGSTTPDETSPIGYLREDVAEQTVYVIGNNEYNASPVLFLRLDDKEHKIYDFINYNEGWVTPSYMERESVSSCFEFNNVAYNGYAHAKNLSTTGCYESLGLVRTDVENQMNRRHGGFDFFGWMPQTTGGGAVWPCLSAIVAADGTVLYYDEDNDIDNAGVDKINADASAEIKIATMGGAITISAPNEIGHVEIYNVAGNMVYSEDFKATVTTIPTDAMLRGVYVVKAGNASNKIVVR